MLAFITFWYLTPVSTWAQPLSNLRNNSSNSNNSSNFTRLKNPLCSDGGSCIDDVDTLVKKALEVVLIVAVPLVAVAIIYSGFLLVSGAVSGNPSKIKEGKSALKWSLIGGAILLAAWVIAEAIDATVKDLSGTGS